MTGFLLSVLLIFVPPLLCLFYNILSGTYIKWHKVLFYVLTCLSIVLGSVGCFTVITQLIQVGGLFTPIFCMLSSVLIISALLGTLLSAILLPNSLIVNILSTGILLFGISIILFLLITADTYGQYP